MEFWHLAEFKGRQTMDRWKERKGGQAFATFPKIVKLSLKQVENILNYLVLGFSLEKDRHRRGSFEPYKKKRKIGFIKIILFFSKHVW
jgi:hypothetical protein